MRRLALLLLVSLAVTSCAGDGFEVQVGRSDESATSTTVAYDGRLHTAYVSTPYEERGPCMCFFNVEPAPANLSPSLTREQALEAINRTDFFRGWKDQGREATVWFGIFAGNEPNPNAPDGRLTGGHWVTDVPAWLVIVHDLSFVPSMSNTPVAGYALAVFQDADPTKTITGIDETGGAEPVLY